MSISTDKRTFSLKKVLQWGSVALIVFSVVPCILVYVLTPIVITRAIQEKANYGLQIFFPLCSTTLVVGLGLLCMVASLFTKDETVENPSEKQADGK